MSCPTYRHGFFPFPVPETTDPNDVGIGTPFLIGYPLEKVAEIYWRAKKFKMQVNATGNLPQGSKYAGYPMSDISASLSDDGFMTWDKGDEIGGITGGGFDLSATVQGDGVPITQPGTTPPYPPFDPSIPGIALDQNYWGPYHANMTATLSLTMFFAGTSPSGDIIIGNIKNPQCVKYQDLYYPTMAFTIVVAMGDYWDHVVAFGLDGSGTYYPNGTNDNPSAHWEGATYLPVVPPPSGGESYGSQFGSGDIVEDGSFNLTGTIFGQDIGGLGFTLPEKPTTGNAHGGQEVDYSGDINIDISEWWPWNPGDGGGPFYDANSGAALR